MGEVADPPAYAKPAEVGAGLLDLVRDFNRNLVRADFRLLACSMGGSYKDRRAKTYDIQEGLLTLEQCAAVTFERDSLGLFYFTPDQAHRRPSYSKYDVTVDDIDDVTRRFKAVGIAINYGAKDSMHKQLVFGGSMLGIKKAREQMSRSLRESIRRDDEGRGLHPLGLKPLKRPSTAGSVEAVD